MRTQLKRVLLGILPLAGLLTTAPVALARDDHPHNHYRHHHRYHHRHHHHWQRDAYGRPYGYNYGWHARPRGYEFPRPYAYEYRGKRYYD